MGELQYFAEDHKAAKLFAHGSESGNSHYLKHSSYLLDIVAVRQTTGHAKSFCI
jgi:hypothetical protein